MGRPGLQTPVQCTLAGVVLAQCPGGGRREGTPISASQHFPLTVGSPALRFPGARGPAGEHGAPALLLGPESLSGLPEAGRAAGLCSPRARSTRTISTARNPRPAEGGARPGLPDAGYGEEQGERGLSRLKSDTRTELPPVSKGLVSPFCRDLEPLAVWGPERWPGSPVTEGEGPGRAGRPVRSCPVWPTRLGPAPHRGRTQVRR